MSRRPIAQSPSQPGALKQVFAQRTHQQLRCAMLFISSALCLHHSASVLHFNASNHVHPVALDGCNAARAEFHSIVCVHKHETSDKKIESDEFAWSLVNWVEPVLECASKIDSNRSKTSRGQAMRDGSA